jgi:short-subunit dehydrogenase
LKTILITGASGGLGKELALFFAKNNWQVIATMLHIDEAKNLQLPNIKCYYLDVTSTESITKAKEKILKDFKIIDVVINNAGLGYRSFVELSEDSKIDSIVDVNFLGTVKVCRAFIPVFRAQNNGLFINITSVAGLVNLPLGSFYHATKQAVESFSESMAYELLAFNCKVCTVQFGNVATDFQKNVTKSERTNIASYNTLMDTISALLHKKSAKNSNLLPKITNKVYQIAENQPHKFRRYTIGFDANAIKYLRRIFGYRLFNVLIRWSVFK